MVTKTIVFEMFLSIKFEYILCTKKTVSNNENR